MKTLVIFSALLLALPCLAGKPTKKPTGEPAAPARVRLFPIEGHHFHTPARYEEDGTPLPRTLGEAQVSMGDWEFPEEFTIQALQKLPKPKDLEEAWGKAPLDEWRGKSGAMMRLYQQIDVDLHWGRYRLGTTGKPTPAMARAKWALTGDKAFDLLFTKAKGRGESPEAAWGYWLRYLREELYGHPVFFGAPYAILAGGLFGPDDIRDAGEILDWLEGSWKHLIKTGKVK